MKKISTAILLHSAVSRKVVVSYKQKYVHKVLVNLLVKLAQEKSVVRWTDRPNLTIALRTKPNKQNWGNFKKILNFLENSNLILSLLST